MVKIGNGLAIMARGVIVFCGLTVLLGVVIALSPLLLLALIVGIVNGPNRMGKLC